MSSHWLVYNLSQSVFDALWQTCPDLNSLEFTLVTPVLHFSSASGGLCQLLHPGACPSQMALCRSEEPSLLLRGPDWGERRARIPARGAHTGSEQSGGQNTPQGFFK